jgi:endonuclease I
MFVVTLIANELVAWMRRQAGTTSLRALFYMDVRYEGGTHGGTGASEPDLRLTDDLSLVQASATGNNVSVAHMGRLSTLLQWHQEDPVDGKEILPHERAFLRQLDKRRKFSAQRAQCVG